MGSENAHGYAQNAENGLSICGLFEVIQQKQPCIFNDILVTCDETWVSFMNGETKE
jgi:hypothetical protein